MSSKVDWKKHFCSLKFFYSDVHIQVIYIYRLYSDYIFLCLNEVMVVAVNVCEYVCVCV